MTIAPSSSPFAHGTSSVTKVMLRVIYALLPAIAACVWFFGWGVIVNILIAVTTALLCEALILKLRQRPIMPYLLDGSALLTAVLLAVALPPLSPWWLTVLGVGFAIIIAKHLYGGLGYNPFNPAMVGYVVLLISFPREMSSWLSPQILSDYSLNFAATITATLNGQLPNELQLDALTMATPLDTLKSQLRLDHSISETVSSHPIFGLLGGKGWEWINGALLLGGLWLIYKRVITWHIPAAVIGTVAAIAALFYLYDAETYASPLIHTFSGATIMGAFFIATDPVTASATLRGRLLYGAGIGLLTYIIRTWGGYPDGFAFAVLLMNMVAPTIDHYYQPRVFGHKRK
ncbi:MAG: electron transport complex subunit RsxD [Gammaproteobacteria bacterium]|nr:electron transport complex subunit RsxD [Gammaproteobacteria bacterium]